MKNISKLLMAGAAFGLSAALPAHAERGSDGTVNLIYWQAPSTMNIYLSGGTKELEAASMVIEPLARYSPTGEMVPFLVEEIPTVENGGVSEDLKTITWKLKEGLKWSDGTPVTAEDAVFTAEYCMHPEGGCAQLTNYSDVEKVEAVDDRTIRITFSVAKPFPYGPFVGGQSPLLQKAQFKDCLGTKAPECTEQNFAPIGTGPFVVTDFKVNDVIALKANEHYRDPAKPAFATVNFKGGGDATAAARAVLETGEFDYAWNTQVDPVVLTDMEAKGKGEIAAAFGTLVERIMVNQTNPAADLGDKRSVFENGKNAHPFLSDPAVRKALSLAIDRKILVELGYGPLGTLTCNVLPAPEAYNSSANDACLEQDIEGAKKLLDEAGWVPGSGGVREKDGVKLSMLFQTSTNSIRQDFQAIIKDWWKQIGVETELRNVDASVFFGGDPGSPDTFQKFYADVEMYANNFDGTDPEAYMANWLCREIPTPTTQWQGNNIQRFCSKEYDALVAEMGKTASIEKRGELAKKMNDLLVQSYTIIPLVYRGRVSAHSNTLEGVEINAWDSELWNIADWSRKK